jgi:hypothetical protein
MRLSSYGFAKAVVRCTFWATSRRTLPGGGCCSSMTSSTPADRSPMPPPYCASAIGDLWTCALLDKPERREVEVKVDFVGFRVGDVFVAGYGIDYAEKYRYLPYIGIVV